MKFRPSRLLIAPATALAVAVSMLSAPAASAATVTFDGEQCTITPHKATIDRLNADLARTSFNPTKAMHNAVRAAVPSATSFINALKRDSSNIEAQAALTSHLVEQGASEDWASMLTDVILDDINGVDGPTDSGLTVPEEPTTTTKAEAQRTAPIGVANLVSARLEPEEATALYEDIMAQMHAGNLDGARKIARDTYVAATPSRGEGETAKDNEILQEYYRQLPDSHFDNSLYFLWANDACAEGREMNKDFFSLESRKPLNPGQQSSGGSLNITINAGSLGSGSKIAGS